MAAAIVRYEQIEPHRDNKKTRHSRFDSSLYLVKLQAREESAGESTNRHRPRQNDFSTGRDVIRRTAWHQLHKLFNASSELTDETETWRRAHNRDDVRGCAASCSAPCWRQKLAQKLPR
ncbi:unnamed protein product [Lampetra planeri]